MDESDNSAESWDHDEDHPDAVGVFKSVFSVAGSEKRRHFNEQHNTDVLDSPDLAHKVSDQLYDENEVAEASDAMEHGYDE